MRILPCTTPGRSFTHWKHYDGVAVAGGVRSSLIGLSSATDIVVGCDAFVFVAVRRRLHRLSLLAMCYCLSNLDFGAPRDLGRPDDHGLRCRRAALAGAEVPGTRLAVSRQN